MLVFAGCTAGEQDNKGGPKAPNPVPYAKSLLNKQGTEKIIVLVNDYYLLKDALVAGDAAKADAGAQKLQNSATHLERFLIQDSTNTIRLQPDTDSLLSGIAAILAVKDETTEYKRIWLAKVSDAIYNIIKKTGLTNAGVYRQYCPMALNDKGAYWLSNEAEIRNPYFGTKMLECGEITDTL